MRPVLHSLSILAVLLVSAVGACSLGQLRTEAAAVPQPAPTTFWRVDELRRGMKGFGRTVLQGSKIESFQVEILGVLRNTTPGRDLVLARLSGLGLEKTGVIAGMSGSPVYIDGKLLGAVAYAWAFGTEPIAGITPFSQMQGFVETLERRETGTVGAKAVRLGYGEAIRLEGRQFDSVTVAQNFEDPPEASQGLYLMPLRTPLMATGFTRHSLELLGRKAARFGMVPMTGGGATARIVEQEKEVTLEPGGALAVALITGDFDLSGIGTVTHLEGNQVYGWGHPFMSLGACQLPMMTGYIHTIYPRQTVSFKMGSPLREVGMLHADVSTCISGVLDRKADMLPMKMRVTVGKNDSRTFQVRIARHRSLLPTLVYTALTNSVDMEGELPEEMTAEMQVTIDLQGQAPIVLKDTFSGFSGGRAPQVLYSQVANVLTQLSYTSFTDLKINKIDCVTKIEPGRRTADIESVQLDAEEYRPGDTVRATVFIRPYKGDRQKVLVELPLPLDLPEGSYTALVCDEPSNARAELRGNPTLYVPSKTEQLLQGLQLLLSAKRTTLTLRVPTGAHGVASAGKALPRLPGSMVHILTNSKRTGAMTMTQAVVAKQPTRWVLQGAESVSFQVSKTKKTIQQEE